MNRESTAASRWRVELARELTPYYSNHPGIRMIVLGGSAARGLSDAYSDLDIVVYWDEIDLPWLEAEPLRELPCQRKMMLRTSDVPTYIESYYFDQLKVDFGHGTMASWEGWVDHLLTEHKPDPSLLGSMGGFLDSIPLHRGEEVQRWKERLAEFPDELAVNLIRSNMGIYVRGCLEHQGRARGDLLFVHQGRAMMLRRILGMLAGLNRAYLNTDEPRWIEWELRRMPLKPERCWERMRAILGSEGAESLVALEELVDEVMGLVHQHRPELGLERRRQGWSKAIGPTEEPPSLGL